MLKCNFVVLENVGWEMGIFCIYRFGYCCIYVVGLFCYCLLVFYSYCNSLSVLFGVWVNKVDCWGLISLLWNDWNIV